MMADRRVEVVVLVSKPPDPEVADRLLDELGAKPAVAAMIGLDEQRARPGIRTARTLDEAAADAVELAGLPRPDPGEGLSGAVAPVLERVPSRRTAVRGLFSGGTLCYESMIVLSRRLGPVHSNTPLRAGWELPAPEGAHVCLDMGEEEYTRGRPHPMIDPEARIEEMRRAGADLDTAVVLLDVVLGYGAHPDPAGELLPAIARARARGVAVVASVCGTDGDPQGLAPQAAMLRQAGVVVMASNAQAARLAALIAARAGGHA
jgi:FdrA protein